MPPVPSPDEFEDIAAIDRALRWISEQTGLPTPDNTAQLVAGALGALELVATSIDEAWTGEAQQTIIFPPDTGHSLPFHIGLGDILSMPAHGLANLFALGEDATGHNYWMEDGLRAFGHSLSQPEAMRLLQLMGFGKGLKWMNRGSAANTDWTRDAIQKQAEQLYTSFISDPRQAWGDYEEATLAVEEFQMALDLFPDGPEKGAYALSGRDFIWILAKKRKWNENTS